MPSLSRLKADEGGAFFPCVRSLPYPQRPVWSGHWYISAERMNVWLWALVFTAPPLKSHLVNKILGIKSRTFYFCHVVAFSLYNNFVKYALPLTSPSSFSAFLLYSFHCIVSSHSFEQILKSTHSSDSKV